MKTFTLIALVLWSACASYATHLLSGHIQVKPEASRPLTYEIRLIVYLDEIRGAAASNTMTSVTLCLGDGQTREVFRESRRLLNGNSISYNSFRINHTYSGPGTYTISASLLNRSPVLNSSNSEVPLSLSTTFLVNSALNQTPDLSILLPSTGFTIANKQRVVFPLQANDPDGDSLVYLLAKPQTAQANNLCSIRQTPSYQYPNDFSRQGTFKLNSRTGELIWDTPTQQGPFSVAITVYEYRNGILLSQTSEEITLLVIDKPVTPDSLPPYEPATEGVLVTDLPDYRDESISFTTFPNPVDDHLQVVIQTNKPSLVVTQLLAINGRELYQLATGKTARKHEQTINMNSLAPGVYLLKATIDGQSAVRKIVKR